jgi:hypothetical protein
MYRHGDVLLIRLTEPIPDVPGADQVVVAEGELTGHAHRVVGEGVALLDVSTDRLAGRLRLIVPRGGRITHEEHHTIEMPAGVYEVRHQRTMTQAGTWERVRD